ncbi:MAG: segregation and condensation protein A [Gemmatimonadales bacterium]|nr:Segregation and condensation protein A [bacterium HR33]GIW51181.1 MAG: segregation and condensation protein A [Gemmatimonadales bacterium]
MTGLLQINSDRAFVVELDEFSGPLDLLLTLIREQQIDITDIPIARIADQFLAAIHELGLNQAADYLEMAAYLLRIKIQMLLPRPIDEEEWVDPRAELVRRLLEYEQIREVADWLGRRAELRSERFARGWVPELPELPPPPIMLSLDDLVATAERLAESLPQRVTHRVVPRPLDTEGATRRIREILAVKEEFDWAELFDERPSVSDVISCLIALLELARLEEVELFQSEPYGMVRVRRAAASPVG